MSDPIDEYEAWLRSWASERTVDARVMLIRRCARRWGMDGFTDANITDLLGGDLKKWTKATYHGHLNNFCEWAVATGRLPENPMETVRKTKPTNGRPRPLSETDVRRVLAAAPLPMRDWILLALNAGLRVSEVAKIRGEDVQVDGVYVEGKGGVRVTLPCHPDIWAMADRYPRHGFWFPGTEDGHVRSQKISHTVGRLFSSLGIEGSIHRCRHTYGTRLLRLGVNIRKVQTLMRHANLETTANYTAVDEDELRDAIWLLPQSNESPPHPPAA